MISLFSNKRTQGTKMGVLVICMWRVCCLSDFDELILNEFLREIHV
jgi:hypothetical protein